MSRLRFMNIEVDNLTMDESIEAIDELINTRDNAYVVTPNVDHIVQIENGGVLAAVYEHADLILTDGMPLVWISKWYGTPIKQKVSGSDLYPKLCELAAKKGYRMFFLGAAEGVAAKAADNLTRKFDGLNVVGTYSPPIGFDDDKEEIDKIISMIRELRPHILVVALGCPKQESFIYKYKDELKVPVSLGLGASVDFEAGVVRRAPVWMSRMGLEWLFRMIQDPKRMVKRYLIDDMKIFSIALKYKKRK